MMSYCLIVWVCYSDHVGGWEVTLRDGWIHEDTLKFPSGSGGQGQGLNIENRFSEVV